MSAPQLRSRLPLLPDEAEVISADLAIVRRGGRLVLFNAAGPIYECGEDDDVGVRLAIVLAAFGL